MYTKNEHFKAFRLKNKLKNKKIFISTKHTFKENNKTGSKIVCSEVIFALKNASGKIEQTQ